MFSGRFVDPAQFLDEPAFVHCSDLIQHDLPRLALEAYRYARRIRAAFRRHGGDDDGIDVLVHLVRGNEEAGAGFADFPTFGGIEAYKEDIETGNYHRHSLRSHVEGGAVS